MAFDDNDIPTAPLNPIRSLAFIDVILMITE